MQHIDTRDLDCHDIVFRALGERENLRDLPEAIVRASDLARNMAIELLCNADDGRPHYVNQRSLDAVLAMIQGTAEYLAHVATDLVGAEDADLPKRR